jgi:hypothetical protein
MQNKKWFCRFLWIVLFAMSISSVSAQAASTLAQYRDVVVAENAPAPVKAAAADLQYYLNKIAGREFPLVREKAGEGFHFYVGSGFYPELDAKAEKLAPEGWMIAGVPDGVLLTGSNAATPKLAGVGHAVSLFLEEQCGVRWLWPGESGEVIPRNPDLRIPDLNRSGVPAFRRRQLMAGYPRYWAPEQRAEWEVWTRRTRQGDQLNANFGHAWASVIPPQEYFEKHPEWFSLVNGKRIPAQLCISNPQLRDEFVKNLLAKPANQKLDIVSVSANDGYGFCECELCRAKGDDNASYWDFVNDIAKRVKVLRPGLGVGTFAYTYSRQPPKNIAKLPDNVYLSMTSYATQLMLPAGKQEYEKFINGWKSKGVKIVMREYWGMHYWLDLPVVYPREIATEIKLGAAAGMIGAYGETGKNFSTQAPNYYVLTHQLWKPNADPEKTLDEFYAAFGPAAKSVRAYYDTMSDAVHRTWRARDLMAGYVPVVNSYPQMFDAVTLQQAKAALDEAGRKAGNDAVLQARVAFLRRGYEYTALMAELLGLYEKLGRSGFPLETFEYQATVEPGRRAFQNPDFENNLEFFEERLKQPFHYTIAEQNQWLKRAWELGQKRIAMLNASRGDFSLNEGLYAQTLEANIRLWHQTVAKYLGKPDSEIIPLDYTKPKKAGD